MERRQLTKGWNVHRFLFGSGESATPMTPESELIADMACSCTQESLGLGCYHTKVDYDKIDQQQ